MQITEVFDSAKSAVGKKGIFALLIGALLLFLYNLTKQSGGTQVIGVSGGYADADRNADVIISTLQKDLEYSQNEITDYIDGATEGLKDTLTQLGGSFDNLSDRIDSNFKETNSLITDGLESQDKMLSMNFNNILSGIDGINDSIADQTSQIISSNNTVKDSFSSLQTTVNGFGSSMDSIKGQISAVQNQISSIQAQQKPALNTSQPSSIVGVITNSIPHRDDTVSTVIPSQRNDKVTSVLPNKRDDVITTLPNRNEILIDMKKKPSSVQNLTASSSSGSKKRPVTVLENISGRRG